MISDGLPLLVLQQAQQERFRTPRQARLPNPPQRNRGTHAAAVLGQIDSVVEQMSAIREQQAHPKQGAIITAAGSNLDDAAVSTQLAPRGSNTELLTSDEGKVVFRVGDDLSTLRAKTEAYATQDTVGGNPRNNNLIARIDRISLATIADLSLGEIRDDIADEELIWTELWTRRAEPTGGDEGDSTDTAVAALAALTPGGIDAIPVFHGPERDVHVVLASGEVLKAIRHYFPR